MSVQLSVTVRNARLDTIETTIGTTPILRIREGGAPANCAAANSGTVLATVTLPINWMADAASGSKAMAGTWSDTSADNNGTAGHFRIYDSGDTACHIQGTCTLSGGGGDMILDNLDFTAGQPFTVNSFTLTDANA